MQARARHARPDLTMALDGCAALRGAVQCARRGFDIRARHAAARD
ncbi:hypothetical protein BURMUCF1_A1442 [Burkholderia multivorans ATCC BAA-247]|nr:hypothetical protein BURMUCF1_A1442 [Burkholderia multivorans ATCC BAA-247]